MCWLVQTRDKRDATDADARLRCQHIAIGCPRACWPLPSLARLAGAATDDYSPRRRHRPRRCPGCQASPRPPTMPADDRQGPRRRAFPRRRGAQDRSRAAAAAQAGRAVRRRWPARSGGRPVAEGARRSGRHADDPRRPARTRRWPKRSSGRSASCPRRRSRPTASSADGEAQAVLAAAGPDSEEEALATGRPPVLPQLARRRRGLQARLPGPRPARLRRRQPPLEQDPRAASRSVDAARPICCCGWRWPAPAWATRQTADASLAQLGSAPGIRPPSEVVDLIAHDVTARPPLASAALGRRRQRLAHGAGQPQPQRPHGQRCPRRHQPHAVGAVGAGVSAGHDRRQAP